LAQTAARGGGRPWIEDTWLPELSKQAYVSVSALLSDEVKGAIHDAHMRYQNVDPREQSEDGWAACLLQAVVEQAGGGQGGD
jgi:hypothetical protein